MSRVDPAAFPVYAASDELLLPLRLQLGIIRDEIAALQGGAPAAGGGKQAFWFGSLLGSRLTSAWAPLAVASGGMTGNPDSATLGNGGLTLTVQAVVQVRLWAEFSAVGTGEQQVGIQLDETANGAAVGIRGQAQLLTGATMLGTAYDGWLAAGVVIRPAAMTSAATPTLSVRSTSYITAIITPVG